MQKRRNDEGYALVFALVVLLVLSIVGMTIMTLTYRDLKAQQDSIDRMKEQYEVQGEIEKIIGRLENNTGSTSLADIFGVIPEHSSAEAIVGEASAITATMRISSSDDGTDKFKATVECTLKLTAEEESGFAIVGGSYQLTGPCSVEYLSYKISSEEILRQDSEGGGG